MKLKTYYGKYSPLLKARFPKSQVIKAKYKVKGLSQ